MLFAISLLCASLGLASAHATFQEMWVNGVDQGSYCVRLPQSNNPIQSVTSNDIACNASPSAAHGKCLVKPGDSVTVEMHQQPGDRTCSNEAIGGAHYGPLLAYMAKVSDSSTAVGSSSAWFKVAQMGLLSSSPDYFGTQVLNDNCGHFTFTIPTGISPGDYLIRAEAIALHVASSVGGAQFYMSCFQVTVGGSGTVNPPTVKLPGAYSAQDPGILVDIHQSLTAYTIPGPTAYNQASPAVAKSAWPAAATWNTAGQPKTDPTTPPAGNPGPSSTAASTTAAPGTTSGTGATTTASAPGATQTKYGQCGGSGYTGPTACASGSTCKSSSPYYSQCL